MFSRKPSLKSAFTLIELLVVIAIIAILAAILFPVFAQARESARITTALSSAKQVNLATMLYANDNEDTLPLGGMIGASIDHPSVSASDWQRAIFPYVKSAEVYRIPGDRTRTQRFTTRQQCIDAIQRQANSLSTVSWLMNYSATRPVMNGPMQSRQSERLSGFSSPAQYILFMNGRRPIVSGIGTGQRFNADPPDMNGDRCSLWMAIYSQRNFGGAAAILNPANDPAFNSAPHHDRGVIFTFLDGSARMVSIGKSGNAHRALEGRMPYCRWGMPNAEDPLCTYIWNTDDSL